MSRREAHFFRGERRGQCRLRVEDSKGFAYKLEPRPAECGRI